MQFCHFPTTVWANQCPTQIAIVWNKGEDEVNSSSFCSSFFNLDKNNISWQELDDIIAKVIQNLTELKVKPTQLIAYSGKNPFISLLYYCAVLKMGASILMLNPALTESQREQILKQNNVDFFITDHHFISFIQIEENITDISFNKNSPTTFTLTSGSSGKPKTVVHSIENHFASAEGVCELMDFKQQQSWLLSLPLFHVSGQGIVWRWLKQGATLYIDANKETFWETLSKVTHASLVPTQLQSYLTWLVKKKKTKIAQKILLGGANIPASLIKQAKQKGITTFASYGLTEMASTVTAIEDQTDNVGYPLLNRDIKIIENEIWVKGKSLALGYWQDQKIIPLTNQQGWFETKDCGYWKENKLVIKGRLDNMFISGGENIQPEEIEQVLFKSDLIKTIFIVPIKDHKFGERPLAVVEFKQDFSPQAVKLLQDFAKNQLEKFKQPVAYLSLETDKFQSGIKLSRQVLKDYVSKNVDLKG